MRGTLQLTSVLCCSQKNELEVDYSNVRSLQGFVICSDFLSLLTPHISMQYERQPERYIVRNTALSH
jgi:hypothetical protein